MQLYGMSDSIFYQWFVSTSMSTYLIHPILPFDVFLPCHHACHLLRLPHDWSDRCGCLAPCPCPHLSPLGLPSAGTCWRADREHLSALELPYRTGPNKVKWETQKLTATYLSCLPLWFPHSFCISPSSCLFYCVSPPHCLSVLLFYLSVCLQPNPPAPQSAQIPPVCVHL